MAKAFPGRVIIDHRPKTGGIAIASWLLKELGPGCVSTNLIGSHDDLIASYGGQFSIIIAHANFRPGERLDPRYQYVTWLREPVDRVISWLFYALYDAKIDENSKHVREAAEIFLRSDGKECPDNLLSDYSNHYVSHFSAIGPAGESENASWESRLDAAVAAVQQFNIVGLYEDFPGFLAEAADLIGVEAPAEIRRLNVSTRRPRLDEVSPALRERINELNEYDTRFYSQIVDWKKNRVPVYPPAKALNNGTGWLWHDPKDVLLTRPIGKASLISPVPNLIIDERTVLRVNFRNQSPQNWPDTGRFPVRASYHWLLPSGEAHIYDGLRSPLPAGGIPAGEAVSVDMNIAAPSEPGVYTLVLSLVQERFSWLERRGFEPTIVQVEVRGNEPAPAPRAKWFRLRSSAR